MIKLSRLNGQCFYLNAELIEYIESSPDTVITLHNGKTVMVIETVPQVLQRIIQYRRRVNARRTLKKKPEV